MDIKEQMQLDAHNLISFRKKLHALELQMHMKKMLDYAASYGAKKVGSDISVSYAVDGELMDVEMYIPLDRKIPSNHDFTFKPCLYLENCVATTHKGNPPGLENTMKKMNAYIVEKRLTPISAGFIVTIHEITSAKDLELFEVDIYISISPNVV